MGSLCRGHLHRPCIDLSDQYNMYYRMIIYPKPIHWRGAPKGSVDEEPVSDHWHKSTEDEAAEMEADLEHDRADGE